MRSRGFVDWEYEDEDLEDWDPLIFGQIEEGE